MVGCEELAFAFFDTQLRVASEIPEVTDALKQLFESFLVPADDSAALVQPDVVCLIRKSGSDDVAIQVDERSYRAPRNRAVSFCHRLVFTTVLRKVRSHLLFHAAVVEKQGIGGLIAGTSGAGKSTLALELVGRGFRLLSDDLAPVRVTDCRVESFPRNVAIWPDTARMLDRLLPRDLPVPMPAIGPGGKLIVPQECVGIREPGYSCPVSVLVLLEDGPARDLGHCASVLLSGLPEGLTNAVGSLPGVSDLSSESDDFTAELRFHCSTPRETIARIDRVCSDFEVAVIGSSLVKERVTHVPGVPDLEPLAKRDAAMLLLGHLGVGGDSEFIQYTLGGSGARLLFQAGRLAERCACATLSVGGLAERADRICELFDEVTNAGMQRNISPAA